MLNILKKKNFFFYNKLNNYSINNKNKNNNNNKNDKYTNIIYYPCSTKEWVSSIYSYNKSYTKPLIVYNVLLNKLFGGYFNMLQYKIKILHKHRSQNKYRYSANKIYISKSELKHINTKLIIILYVFNKQKISIVKYIKNLIALTNIYKKLIGNNEKYITIANFKNNHEISNNKITYFLKNKTMVVLQERSSKILKFNQILSYRNRLIRAFENNFFTVEKWDSNFFKVTDNLFQYFILKIKNKFLYETSRYNLIYLDKIYTIQKLFIYYSKWIYFNKSKFNNLVLNIENLGLINLIGKIYNKKIEIKLVELKSLHLNSDIFSYAVALKLKRRKNKMYKVLRKAVIKIVKVPDFNALISFDDNVNTLNKNNILAVIKQQVVSGVRFEASGRLTRRLTAMRSTYKCKFVGSLKNVRSSYSKKPSTLLRGYVKSNSQYTVINSKTRNGTFGLKNWISSH